MIYRVTVLPEAQQDLDEIIEWIARASPEGAARLLSRFHERLASLETFAESHGLAPEDEFVDRTIRQMLFKTRHGRVFRALFEIVESEVRILHVRAAERRLLRPDEI